MTFKNPLGFNLLHLEDGVTATSRSKTWPHRPSLPFTHFSFLWFLILLK